MNNAVTDLPYRKEDECDERRVSTVCSRIHVILCGKICRCQPAGWKEPADPYQRGGGACGSIYYFQGILHQTWHVGGEKCIYFRVDRDQLGGVFYQCGKRRTAFFTLAVPAEILWDQYRCKILFFLYPERSLWTNKV